MLLLARTSLLSVRVDAFVFFFQADGGIRARTVTGVQTCARPISEDPRATHLRRLSQELGQRTGEPKWHEIAERIEKVVMDEKGLYPNVDFYAATVYHYLGVPTDLMTPIFALARMVGWTAHVREQYADNRLIRPESEYIGPRDQHYVPIEERG